jgi:AcrR family transcriptional regulator
MKLSRHTVSSTSPAPRWQRRPEHRPEEILDAALRVFAQRGLHQTSLEEVAKEAGISKGTIYLYFKNKEELFVAAAQRVVPHPDEIDKTGSTAPDTGSDLAQLLHEIAQTAYRRFCTPAYLAFFSMMAAEALRHPEWGELYFRRVVLALNHRLAEIFTRAIQAGQCRPIDPVLVSRAFVGMFLMMALSQEHLGGKKYTPLAERTVIDTLTDIFLRGLAPEDSRQS